jgi:hopanoid biosynthesis associated radical SAM protein HpnH
MVSIPGGEPLMHPQINEIVEGLVARKKYIYLCTNALLLKEKLDLFKPSKYLTFSVHMDGQKGSPRFRRLPGRHLRHRRSRGSRSGQARLPRDHQHHAVRRRRPQERAAFFDEMMDLGVEGMMLSPGYSYDKAPISSISWAGARPASCSPRFSATAQKAWKFNQSPLFLEFLMGKRQYTCTPWGMPTYNVFGWQKPCYLLQDGYADTFAELMETTELGQLRHRERQPQMRQLHGPQRLRSQRRRPPSPSARSRSASRSRRFNSSSKHFRSHFAARNQGQTI